MEAKVCIRNLFCKFFSCRNLLTYNAAWRQFRKLQFRFACDSEHFWPFWFKLFIFRHIFFSNLVFFIGFILRQAYTAREAEDLGKASLCRTCLPPIIRRRCFTCRRRASGECVLCRTCLPLIIPIAVQCPPQTGATRKIRAKASCR